MQRYNPKEIEPKWQKVWEEQGIYRATEESDKPKRYVLEYFPYPSGAAMHVGHVRNYTIGDVVARFYRMRGYNVLHPMGWDAFGLPAENYAIKNNISPQQAIAENTTKFKQQLMQMGFSYDWSREINSSDPSYYKWTQWFFKLLFEKGLAYQKESLQWWCETDKTVLANEQVEAGKCWRCGNEVTKKSLKQWFFKITDYADRLIDDLDKLDWSEAIKSMQRNWIGRSSGAEINFKIDGRDETITVFTTRHDTQYGVTFLVLAPEHPLSRTIATADQKAEVERYVAEAERKSDVERMGADDKAKTGIFSGAYAINPTNNERIPIWIADYVLGGYGTGAVMGVPAHDDRDHEFAKKYGLEIRKVLKTDTDTDFHSEGTVINSDIYNGMRSEDMREKILHDLIKAGSAKEKINYKIRDWLISRQRYWGAPIPIIHCEKDGAVAVPDDQLPVVLPEVKSYQPTGEGTSVLASVHDWVTTTCPKCGGAAKRETDTMDGFACSSWYFLRFTDPHNQQKPFEAEKVKFWLPVDDYIGGAEHAVMHLLYARMWTKVMYDTGLIEFDEPFTALRNHGMILAPDGRKMSKSWGNVIAPDDLISQGYGADTIRIMELFIGPWDQSANWSVEGVGGCYRFLQRVWTLLQEYNEADHDNNAGANELVKLTHQTIARVSADIHEMGFNTAIAALMEMVNQLYKIKAERGFIKSQDWQFVFSVLIKLLAPFAPHISEELWQQLGNGASVHASSWPVHDERFLVSETVIIVVQVNGKLRAQLIVNADITEEEATQKAKSDPKVASYIDNKEIKKTIYVPGKLVNLVV
ncbi:MAG TPA: leucine--tRNA ligase [Candidatus Limnocylindrales bacterium]|nr:leucine--tRNA ligase [Candidatus Limnocylindrales bacterium]